MRVGNHKAQPGPRSRDRRLQYGGRWFTAASALAFTRRTTRSGVRGIALLAAAGIRRPWQILALSRLLVHTPSEHLHLSDTAAGQALRDYFGRRYLGFLPITRLCRGVLILPRRHSDYLRGRRREAVRRNLRRAAAAGITCETSNDRSRAIEHLIELSEERLEPVPPAYAERWHRAVARPETTIMLAHDAGRRPVAAASAVIDDTVCLIEFAVANSHEARWALHDHIVRLAIERRVRYLLAEGDGPFGALGFPPAVQRYQHMHGYELRHVKPRPVQQPAWLRKLLVCLVATATTAYLVVSSVLTF